MIYEMLYFVKNESGPGGNEEPVRVNGVEQATWDPSHEDLICHNSKDIVNLEMLTPHKMRILRCMGSKFYVKFRRASLKFHTKFWTHTPQIMHFTVFNFCAWVTISFNCDVISLSETGPCRHLSVWRPSVTRPGWVEVYHPKLRLY